VRRFPHRHGDATGKPETRDETRGCRKTSISCETPSNFGIFDTLANRLECHKVRRLQRKTTWQPAWKPSKKRGFAASPIDTAMPQENQRLETRRVGAPKRAFCARLPPIFTLCSFKSDVFLWVFLRTWKFAKSKSMFLARLSSVCSTSLHRRRRGDWSAHSKFLCTHVFSTPEVVQKRKLPSYFQTTSWTPFKRLNEKQSHGIAHVLIS